MKESSRFGNLLSFLEISHIDTIAIEVGHRTAFQHVVILGSSPFWVYNPTLGTIHVEVWGSLNLQFATSQRGGSNTPSHTQPCGDFRSSTRGSKVFGIRLGVWAGEWLGSQHQYLVDQYPSFKTSRNSISPREKRAETPMNNETQNCPYLSNGYIRCLFSWACRSKIFLLQILATFHGGDFIMFIIFFGRWEPQA